MRELSDDDLDQIVRETWGNGWMLPGEPQRMLVRAGYAAGYRAAQAEAPPQEPTAQAADPAADPIADLCAQIKSFLADAPQGMPHEGYRYGELLSFAADALERLRAERDELRAMLQGANRDAARLATLVDKYKWQVRDTCTRAERAEAERDAAKEELQSVLDDWNAIVRASGSPTNGGAVGYVAALCAERDALRECVKAADKLRYNYFMGDGKLYDAARAKVKP